MNTTHPTMNKTGMIKGPAGSIYVDDYGTGDIPVIFLHSFGGSSEHWENQLKHLREHTRAIALDFRAHGKSDPPTDKSYTAESLASDLEAVVDDLELNRFVLVGHSMGGPAAIAYAAAHPDRVAGIVLAGAPGKTSEEQSKPIIASLESDQYEKVMDQYMKQLLEGAKPNVSNVVTEGFKKLSKETSINVIKSLFQYDPIPALKKYKGPVLIISTSRETTQPNTLAKQMPNIPNKTIEGTSHWTQLDKPEEFNKILDDFLKTVKM